MSKSKTASPLSQSKMIFVVGCGRSGMHLLAKTLASDPTINATIEEQAQFNLAVGAVVNKNVAALNRLCEIYRRAKRPYLTKDHTNLWLYRQLKKRFPEAHWVAIERDPYGTIASSLIHEGVLDWVIYHENRRKNPLSGTLGLTGDEFEALPVVARLTLKWMYHSYRIEELRESMLVIDFADLVKAPIATTDFLAQQLGLKLTPPKTHLDVLYKWQHQLLEDEINIIEDTLVRYETHVTNQIKGYREV